MSAVPVESTVTWPTPDCSRVPFRIYTDEALYEREQKELFRGPIWNFVGVEAEIPNAGDYKTTFVGDTPVVVVRDHDGSINCVVNRCAHRGATLAFDGCGNKSDFTCVYHNWRYDLKGKLQSVAFQNGVRRVGGMPEDFDMCKHNLTTLRVETICGIMFATFSDATPPLREWLGPRMVAHMERTFSRPIEILGTCSQVLHNNWKLYIENVKDSYHASLLHTFFTTFKLNRLTMDGGVFTENNGGNHISWSKRETDRAEGTSYEKAGELRAMKDDFSLADPSLLQVWGEYEDGITHAIQGIFPTFVVQQVQNSLALRLLVPRGVNECELFWILIGYADDTPEERKMRLKQSNLVGPAGLVSMEDGIIGELVQRAIKRDTDKNAVLEMGGRNVEDQQSRVSEAAVRGFWQAYRAILAI